MPEFRYQDPFPCGEDLAQYRLLTRDYVSTAGFEGRPVLKVDPEGLVCLAADAMRDVSFLLRSSHNEMVARILSDPEASSNDRAVAAALLRNAEIAAGFELPLCQDTGTATVIAEKGQSVWTGVRDEEYLSKGIFRTYTEENLRYSQNVPLSMFEERNSGTNLPAQVDIRAVEGDEYKFLFMAKGGGSSNKTYLFQETREILTPGILERFLIGKMKTVGTSACPPYHLAFVIGGTSADLCLKTVKLAAAGYYDHLPSGGNEGGRAFRDRGIEQLLLRAARDSGIGAQFGGAYFVHDVRVIRLPRHGASLPVGMGVSCSADRNIKAFINRDGIWLEELDRNPGRLIPDEYRAERREGAVRVDIDMPMKDVLYRLSGYPVGTPLLLSGTIVVARDMAHARFRERVESGTGLPNYLRNHPVYYAGPAKTPPGRKSGSFGPTTAGRMDEYVDMLQSLGGSMIMIAKGERSSVVVESCKKHGGFYLGSIGGAAALLAEDNIKKVECIDYCELGMEAVWKVEVKDFPAFTLIDDKGNDFSLVRR